METLNELRDEIHEKAVRHGFYEAEDKTVKIIDMETFKGKAIYNPPGKAGEYAEWACNFYVGCSNQCTYCFLRKGIGKAILGGNTPTLKKSFRDEAHALEVFEKELKANLPELQKHGLFFSFTTDPFLPETADLTVSAICLCLEYCINVKVLTKRCDWIDNSNFFPFSFTKKTRKHIAFGFTLTGHDELEPNASTNAERIEAMRKLHEAGFKTWASIEPVIDFDSSWRMISQTLDFCDLYKIGLESGKKYNTGDLKAFVYKCEDYIGEYNAKIYFKDSLLKQAGISRSELPENCVNRDYNIFNNK